MNISSLEVGFSGFSLKNECTIVRTYFLEVEKDEKGFSGSLAGEILLLGRFMRFLEAWVLDQN